jgi:citrate/tricarballylate utilization protein
LVGATGLVYLKMVSDKRLENKPMLDLDYLFLYLLDATALTGVFTLFLRSTALLGVIFTLHIGLVLSLFLTAPYGKFVHFVYRFVAMVNNRLEEQIEKS